MTIEPALAAFLASDDPHLRLSALDALQKAGRHRDVVEACERMIDRESDMPSADLWYVLAMSHFLERNIGRAGEALGRALTADPDHVRSIELFAMLSYTAGDHDSTVEALGVVLAAEPNNYAAWELLSRTLVEIGDPAHAREAATHAIEIDRERPEGYFAIAEALWLERRLPLAASAYDRGLSLCTEPAPGPELRRLCLAQQLEDFEYMETALPRLADLPYSSTEVVELGRLQSWYLHGVRRSDEAVELLRSLIAERPTVLNLRVGLGIMLAESGRAEEAFDAFRQAYELAPGAPHVRFNLALAQMTLGHVTEGLENYEARWEGSTLSLGRRHFKEPQWNGEPLAGKKLLVWGEQGIGDQILFGTMLPDLERSGADVTIECHHKIVSLFADAFPWARATQLPPLEAPHDDDRYAAFDYQVPMGSLARVLRRTKDAFPEPRGYLRRKPAIEARWRERLLAGEDKLLVGIAWRSAMLSGRRNSSYVTTRQLKPLARVAGVRFVILQHDVIESELADLRSHGLDIVLPEGVDQRDDLPAVCEVLGGCDAMVTAAVSVGSLAGALGVPQLVLGGRTSWTLMGEKNSPWYPGHRLFPLDPLDPEVCLGEIADALSEIVATRRTR